MNESKLLKLSAFAGNYKIVEPDKLGQVLLSITHSELRFNFGKGLEKIPAYYYNPVKSVVHFFYSGTEYKLILSMDKDGLACIICITGGIYKYAFTTI